MCGRGACTLEPQAIQKFANAKEFKDKESFKPSFNVGPTSFQPILMLENGEKIVRSMRWGLVPCYSKNSKSVEYSTINARSEGIQSNSTWSGLLSRNRCVLLSNGYYEWKEDNQIGKKQPFFFHFPDNEMMGMAALYDIWKSQEGEKLYTYTIITTEASSELQRVHHRMPVILRDSEEIQMWIDVNHYPQFNSVKHLLRSFPSSPIEGDDLLPIKGDEEKEEEKTVKKLQGFAVSNLVNYHKNDSPDCIERLSVVESRSKQPKLSSFFQKKETKVVKLEVKSIKKEEPPALEDFPQQSLGSSKKRSLDEMKQSKGSTNK